MEISEEELGKLLKNQKKIKTIKKLDLVKTKIEGINIGTKTNGIKYSVREHRGKWILPLDWEKFFNSLKSRKAIVTFDALINTGGRINEIRHIEERDVDYDRNNLTLRITKCKAKKGEAKGKPRTIPISSAFTKRLRKYFKGKNSGEKIGILSTPGSNIALKKGLKSIGIVDYEMYSIHNIRKTHGNWLKVLGNLRIISIDASEICLRLGHDYNTFLSNYGSSGVMSSEDVQTSKKILDDLYE